MSEVKEKMTTNEIDVVKVDGTDKILILSKPINFEGKEYKEIDLSDLENMTTKHLKQARRMMNANSASLDIFSDRSVEFATYLASIVTGYPVAFFDCMPAKDGMELKNRVSDFLY